MILEDIDDYPISSTTPAKIPDNDLNLIIKSYERKNSLGKKEFDSSEKKMERQNSRKKNLLENSGIISGRR